MQNPVTLEIFKVCSLLPVYPSPVLLTMLVHTQDCVAAGRNSENVAFLIDVQQYRRLKKSERPQAAKDIMNTFLAENATHPVNISGALREAMQRKVRCSMLSLGDRVCS